MKLVGFVLCAIHGHKIVNGIFPIGDDGHYYVKEKCIRCGIMCGIPKLTEKYMKEKFPVPLKRNSQ